MLGAQRSVAMDNLAQPNKEQPQVQWLPGLPFKSIWLASNTRKSHPVGPLIVILTFSPCNVNISLLVVKIRPQCAVSLCWMNCTLDPAPLGFGLPVFRDLFGLIRGQYVDREGSVVRRRHAPPPPDRRSAADEVRYIVQGGGKEELHDASKRVRKASTSGDKGSCSGHVDEQNRLQQETSSATASQLHRQLAKPGQEAGTAAAAGQVARQPERELATAPAVTDTDVGCYIW
ncbi:unnamed protein product [Pleuronectes platessa]|uniref:Uncharacterized protein n=1 Tax=Pleuronectes platessa TaxID=8262 RepID=A0A9N7Y5S9_PLEPL|nr:unnamed protein product [Pleuronectes platessa]